MLTPAVLGALAPGEPVSGAALARTAGVTRAAIWKQVETLRQRGLPIEARVGGGYRLPWPVQLLDETTVRSELPVVARQRLGALEVHWELDSTSSELQRRLPNVPDLSIVMAEAQTAGRGRRGKSWISPPGLNIYLSVAKHFDAGFARLSGLSLAIGVMVLHALEDVGIRTAGLKWPNDILAADAKLAGVLVELSGEFQGPCTAVIGIGLNMRVPDVLRAQATQPVTDIAALCGGEPPDRNLMAAALITRLVSGLERFEREGFAAFVDDYAAFDLLAGQPLRVIGAQDEFHGEGAGVDGRGALLVRVGSDLKRVDSADVSVRRSVIALLDLGNTRAKFALFDGSALIRRGVVAWDDSAAFALASAWADWPRPDRVVAASVVDSVREAMVDEAAVAAFDRPLQWLRTPARACGVRNAYAEPARLGVDRFLAMVHAYRSGRAPCILVSAGTALTLDALAADGSHLGGLIAPGAQLMYQSVLGATARVKPDAVGQVVDAADNTADGLFAGCWHAAAALVERFTARMAPRLGGHPRVLVGGGDGQALAALVALATEHAPDAVLLGLAACATDGETPLATS